MPHFRVTIIKRLIFFVTADTADHARELAELRADGKGPAQTAATVVLIGKAVEVQAPERLDVEGSPPVS